MNTQEIVTAIQEQAGKLESLEAHILKDCRYYQRSVKEVGTTADPTPEQLLLIGAFLATYQLWHISQPEINHHKAIVYPAIAASALTEANRLCHAPGLKGQSETKVCRGARNLQIQVFFALAILEAPTDQAWQKALTQSSPQYNTET